MTTTFKPIAPQKYDNEKHFSCLVHTAVRVASELKKDSKEPSKTADDTMEKLMDNGILGVVGKTIFCPSTDLTSLESFNIDVFYGFDTPNDRVYDESVERLVERISENENVIIALGGTDLESIRKSSRALTCHAVSQLFRSLNEISIHVSVLTIPSSGEILRDSLSLATQTEACPRLNEKGILEGNVALQIKSTKDLKTMFRTLKDRDELKDVTGKEFSSYFRVLTLSEDLKHICDTKNIESKDTRESVKRLCEDLEICRGLENGNKRGTYVLSNLLRGALDAQVHCSVIVSVSPRIEEVSTSLSALRFADRVRTLSRRSSSSSSFSARKSVILADELSAENLEKRDSLYEMNEIVASKPEEEAKPKEEEHRPMSPPPGAIRKEGMRWVATFQTPNHEAHYVGTFTSQTEALAAYYERAAYYEKLRNVVTSSPSCTPKSSSSMRKLRILMRRHAVSGGQLFNYMDSKRCGRITFEMFKYGLAMVGVHPNRSDAMKLFQDVDSDGDGIILWQDLVQMFASPEKKKKKKAHESSSVSLSSPLSNYQRRVHTSSPDFSKEVNEEEEEEEEEEESLSNRKERHVMETRHRSSSANWLQSLRSPSSSPTHSQNHSRKTSIRSKSPLRTREKRDVSTLNVLNIPKNAIRREGLYWIATYQTPDCEDHYVGTFRTYELAVKRYFERAAYYRTSEEEEEVVEPLKDIALSSNNNNETSSTKNNDEKVLLSPSVPASHGNGKCDEKIVPTSYDQDTKLFIRTGSNIVRSSALEQEGDAVEQVDVSHRIVEEECPRRNQERETTFDSISATDELVEVVRYLRQRLRRADRDIKDYEMYRDVMETTLCNLQREMSTLRTEKDSLLKKNEKVRVGLKRKQVKVLRLEKLVTDLKSQVSDLESSVTAGKAALLFSEEKCQDLRDEIAALREEGRGEEKFHY